MTAKRSPSLKSEGDRFIIIERPDSEIGVGALLKILNQPYVTVFLPFAKIDSLT